MNREAIIQKTIKMLNMLSDEQLREVTGYVLKKHEECLLQNEIEKLVEQSQAFQFLNNDEYLYTTNDIKEKY